jgi:anaerobic magnesium-protoporphyrin IX monomethyl ester cyclase
MATKKILLIYPCYTYPRKNPPMGLAYIAGYLENNQRPVEILDFNILSDAQQQMEQMILANEVLYVGISFMTSQFDSTRNIAKIIKSLDENLPIIVGGPHASSIPEQTLVEIHEVDVVCVGEGEEVSLELARFIENHRKLNDIKGIVFREAGVIINTGCRKLIEDINTLPFPAWHLLDLYKYSVMSGGGKLNLPTFVLLSSRGCPSNCIFCDSHSVFDRKFRARSAENIFAEVEYLHKNYGMVQFDFVDDLITLKKNRIIRFCKLLQESKVDYSWMANARVNTVDSDMLKFMAKAGCVRIDLGVESGDPEVRKRAHKNVTNEQIINAHKNAQRFGITTSTFLMVGNLGEDLNSVKMTAELMLDIAMDTNVAIACPYPGTELYQIARKNDWIKVFDWGKYVTSPTYQSDYEPVMVTDKMDQNEILDAYYLLHSYFVKKKFKARYGRYFLINPHFWAEWVFNPNSHGGYFRKLSMAVKLLSARIGFMKSQRK